MVCSNSDAASLLTVSEYRNIFFYCMNTWCGIRASVIMCPVLSYDCLISCVRVLVLAFVDVWSCFSWSCDPDLFVGLDFMLRYIPKNPKKSA